MVRRNVNLTFLWKQKNLRNCEGDNFQSFPPSSPAGTHRVRSVIFFVLVLDDVAKNAVVVHGRIPPQPNLVWRNIGDFQMLHMKRRLWFWNLWRQHGEKDRDS